MKIAVVQHRLVHYRVDFFNRLKELLLEDGIELELIHGQATTFEKTKNDEGELDWTIKIENLSIRIKGVDLIWQRLPPLRQYKLVILVQENRVLSNYFVLLFSRFLSYKTGFWGHGKNYQSTSPQGLREKWKVLWLKSVDWWFGYTESTTEYLTSKEFPRDRITCLNNAIDTSLFISELDSITLSKQNEIRHELGINEGALVGIFCGSLYAEKKVDFLIKACEIVAESINDFVLIVIGDGPLYKILEDKSNKCSWLKVLGVKTGIEKASYYKISHLMLNPGLVGLHILDSFCAGTPMITTKGAMHSPEIDYLQHNRNGLITNDDVNEYADVLISLHEDEARLNELRKNCLADKTIYSIDAMATSFANGVKACLALEA